MADQLHPFAREGLARRAAPFACVMLLAFAAAPLLPAAEKEPEPLIAAALLNALIVAAVLLVPWRKLPSWAQAAPPIAYLLVIALLREDGSSTPSGYEVLALLPVFWLALYGTLAQLAGALVGAVALFLAPDLLVGSSKLPEGDLWHSAFAVVIGAAVVLVLEAAHQGELRGQSEDRLRTVVETMSDGLVAADEAGRLVMWNRAADEMLGVGAEDVGISRWSERYGLFRPDGVTHVPGEELPLARAIKGERVEDRELLIRNPNVPEGVWIGVSAAPLRTPEGSPAGGVAVLRDITDRKRAEQYRAAQHGVSRALAESTTLDDALPKLLRAIGESMGWELGAFWSAEMRQVTRGSISHPLRVLRFGRLWHAPRLGAAEFEAQCKRITFPSPVGLLGHVWESGTPGWERDITEFDSARIQAAASLGLRGAIWFPVVARSRVLGVVEFFAREMKDPGKDLMGAMASIGSQIGEFMERKHAEGEADRKKDEFFGLVSHELRTPLTSIVGYLDLLLEDEAEKLDDQTRNFLEIARRNGDRLLRLVGDLLLVAQVQTGKFALELGPVDLSSIAAQCVEAAKPVAQEKGISLSLRDGSVPELSGDAGRLSQLLDNLISNALKFAPEGERVEVRLSSGSDRVMAEVSNSGSYIRPDEAANVFERFSRASSATEPVIPGAGLGLAIAKAIVEAHGGRIRFESFEGVGTTFRFWLPLGGPADGTRSREEKAVG